MTKRPRLRWFAAIVIALAFVVGPAFAALESGGTVPALSLQELEDLRAKGVPEASWPALLETLGREEQRAAVRALMSEQKPFPAARLAALLTSPKLAVRLGALDLLEDAAGETFGFDPWQEEPAAGGNADALARWKAWAAGGAAPARTAASLTADTFRALALEIMAGDRERAERAMQRLEVHGLSAIAHIEAFFQSQPALEPAPRAMLKAAEYRVVIRQALPKTAAALARDLALGTPEAQSTAVAALGEGGPGVLPVIAEALASPDPLVRETAVDAAFKAGEVHAVPIIAEHLAREKTESVLHSELRGFGQHAQDPVQIEAIAGFLDHPAENVVISALEALGASSIGDVSAGLEARLGDPRWRVRAAALETIGKRSLRALKAPVIERLQDSDLFVRVSAVNALQKVAAGEAAELLIETFEKQDDLKAPILSELFEGNKPPPARIWDALWKAPPEVILQCLDLLESRDDHEGKRIPYAARFATHPNRDVAASALRLLASRGRHSALLLEALRSEDDLRRDAVLDALRLPPGFLAGTGSASTESGNGEGAGGSNPILDGLYAIFGGSARKPAGGKAQASAMSERHAAPAELRQILERFLREGSPRQRFQAAVALAGQDHAESARFLLASFETLSSLDRRAIAMLLPNVAVWSPGTTLELATRLLRDEADDVREKAIEVWLEGRDAERFKGLLAELARPGSKLRPDDIYGYEADSITQNPGAQKAIMEWGRAVLADPAAPEPTKISAIVLLGRSGQAGAAQVEQFLTSDRPWLRRAANRALGAGALAGRLDALLRDEAAPVRAVLPFLASPHNGGWLHWFSDVASVRDYEDFGGNRYSSHPAFGAWAHRSAEKAAATADPAVSAALEKLTRDPADSVRFEAQFALLRLGKPIDPAALASLIAVQPADAQARDRLGNFLEANYHRLGRDHGVLVPLATGISDSNLAKVLKHFGLDGKKTFTSFAALAQLAPLPATAESAVAPAAPYEPPPAAEAQPFRVLFFYKPGCRDCDRVRDMLARHAADLRQMTIEERDINSTENAVLNETLSARFRLRDTLRQVTPAVFTQAGALVKDDLTFPRLGDLLRNTAEHTPEPAWAQIATPEAVAAQQTITQRYEALSFGVVAAAGLLDGINPCAFATIIFLLSYLQIARRTPREILAVGTAFILAVFLSYFAVGLGLAQVLAKVSALRFAGTALNYGLAAFALVVALLSFRDAQLAAQGQHGEMTLQLPGLLKERIRATIRTGTRSTRFVIAAFGAGIVISLLELACTGQVYLPTILYMLRAGEAGAVGHLLLYNTAFVTPLIVVFLLAWSGLRSDALIRFQKQHTAAVKILTGVLFLLLATLLVFGSALLPRLPLR